MRFTFWLGVFLFGCGASALAAELRLYTEEYRPLSYSDNGRLTGMAVEVVEFDESDPERVRIRANLLVVRGSQKRIVVGSGGRQIKRIGAGECFKAIKR